jgi:uncharacterized protein YciI
MTGTPLVQIDGVPSFHVVFMTTLFASLADAERDAPTELAGHVEASRRLHANGELLLAGAFLDNSDAVSTMGVLTSAEAAQKFVENDPFVRSGMVQHWNIRQWANIFR